MTTLLSFDQSRCRRPGIAGPVLDKNGGSAQVLLFTGVRRERLLPSKAPHAPMFIDPEPAKPKGRGRGRRGKAG